MPGPHSQTKPPSVLTQRPSQAALRHSSMSGGERGELEMGGRHRGTPVPLGRPHPGSPVQRMPLAVSTMEKPRGQTRATSWHPPWLQERSQPYSPHVPGSSETRTGDPQGTDAIPAPTRPLTPAPQIPQGLHPAPGAPLPLPGMGTTPGDAAGSGDKEQRALPGKPGGVPAFGATGSGWVPGQVMPCSPSGHEQRLGAMHKPLPQPKEQSAAGSGDGRPSGGQGPPPAPAPPEPVLT